MSYINSQITKKVVEAVGSAGIGAASFGAVGVIVGKVAGGGALVKIGIAAAGTAVGTPIVAPFAAVGAVVATSVYVAYKAGKQRS